MGQLIEIRDTRLFVEQRGTGPALIVLHGGPGADHTQLLEPLTPLRDEFRLVFVDQRAQGRSDRASKETWTLKASATDVSDLARALDLDTFAVLGHSYGALVALRHALDCPREAAATVISHGVPSSKWYRLDQELDRFEPAEVRREIREAWRRLETAADGLEMTELIVRQAPFHFKDPLGTIVAAEARRYREQMIHTPEVNRYMSETEISDFDWEESLEAIDQPMLILGGRFDRTCPVDASEFMARRISGSRLFVFENSAHVSYVEEPVTYISVVRRFLREHLS